MEFLCAAWFSKFCPYFRSKNFIFLRPALQYIMSSLLILEHKQKRFLNPFQIPIFLFLFYLFGIEPINTLIHSRKFLQNHTLFFFFFFNNFFIYLQNKHYLQNVT